MKCSSVHFILQLLQISLSFDNYTGSTLHSYSLNNFGFSQKSLAPVWHVNDANFMLTSLLTRAEVTRTSCVSSTVVIIPYLRSHLKTEIAYPVRHHLFKRDSYAGFDLARENADKLYRFRFA